MKLQTKVLLIIAFTWLVLSTMLLIDFKYGIIRTYERLETKTIEHQIYNTQHAFDRKLESLALVAQAFSQWDDAYDFMQNKNRKFIESNFVRGSFTNAKINFFMYFSQSGQLYYGKSYDPVTNQITAVPAPIIKYIQQHADFIHNDISSEGNLGILDTELGVIVMVSQPVLTSDGKGPSRGRLLMGYYLTPNEIYYLSEMVSMDLKFWSSADIATDKKLQAITNKLATESYAISYASNNIANGFIPLKDINGKIAGILQIEIPRIVYQQGISTSYHYIAILISLGFLVMILAWISLEHFVIGRILKITHQVARINLSLQSNQPITISGNDELNTLVNSINHMMNVISKSQIRLEHLASYDSLTQIPNREHFHHLLTQSLADAKLHHEKLAIMFLDMDKFKQVNDHYGHAVGDQLLQQAVTRIKKSIRSTDVLGRQSGDEFILFLKHVPSLEYVAATAKRILETTSEPYFINNSMVQVTFSIGISIYPDDGNSVEELFRNADQVMYKIKGVSGNAFQFFKQPAETTEQN